MTEQEIGKSLVSMDITDPQEIIARLNNLQPGDILVSRTGTKRVVVTINHEAGTFTYFKRNADEPLAAKDTQHIEIKSRPISSFVSKAEKRITLLKLSQ